MLGRIVSSRFGRAAGVGLVGASAVGGGISGLLDRQGPYPQIQEAIFGDPEALRYSLKAAISTGITADPRGDVMGTMDYYYGQPVNPNRMAGGRMNPVPGELVFGMYNLRR